MTAAATGPTRLRDRNRLPRAIAAVAAVYTAFLLCAQFGFLAQLESRLGPETRFLRLVLAAMAIGGVTGSWLAKRRLERGGGESAARTVRAGLIATALATAASPLAAGAVALGAAAAALGGALGFATVALAGALPAVAPAGRWGTVAGAGTGIAYALSNLPPLFAGPPVVRALFPALLCALAALWSPRFATQGAHEPQRPPESPLRFAGLVAALLALVAVDSAAFAHVQRTPELFAATWGSALLELRQGAVHLFAALAAGLALDRRRLRPALVAAALLFAVALLWLAEPERRAAAGALYAAGISIYSAALVCAPALAGGRALAPSFSAWLYSLAGWLGSALGVGAADAGAFRGVALLGLAGFALFAAIELAERRQVARRLRTELGAALAVGLAGGAALLVEPSLARSAPASAVDRGREVYLAEGCQHCHSQYVRPVASDELWWGPRRALDRRERPPTPGNRRVGPDLSNVGLRRSDWWQETHLRDPRALSPGSRMPPYAHLFDDERGAALVAYLGSLGAGREAERAAAIAGWSPERAVRGDAARGAPLFASSCARCHGAAGRGDGAAAAAIARPTLDLAKPSFFRVVPAPGETLEIALARAIRFGLPPGSMPGHEWLSDQEVADLVAFVLALGERERVSPPAAAAEGSG